MSYYFWLGRDAEATGVEYITVTKDSYADLVAVLKTIKRNQDGSRR